MSLRYWERCSAAALVILALPLIFVLMASPAAADGPSAPAPPSPWTPTLVTTLQPLPPNEPRGHPFFQIPDFSVDVGRVVWSDTDSHDQEIFLFDWATGRTSQVTDNQEDDRAPILSGSQLAWLRPGEEHTDIVLLDLATGEERVVAAPPVIGELEMAGSYLVWAEDADYHLAPGEPYAPRAITDLRVYNMQTGATFAAGTLSLGGSFGLDGQHLVFVGGGSPPTIVLFDLATRTARTVSSGPYGSYLPRVSGNLATWVEGSGQMVGIMVYDMGTGKVQQVARSAGILAQPKTDGRYVVWNDHNGSTAEIRLFDSRDGTTRLISDIRLMSFGPQISQGRVAWGQEDEHDGEIMLLDLGSGLLTQISNGRYVDQFVRLSGETAAWWQYDQSGSESRVFLSAVSGPALDPGFVDVAGDHRYRTAIAALWGMGVISGYAGPAGPKFRPEAPVLRAQLAKMLVEFFGLPVTEGGEVPFVDLGPDDPANLYPHQYAAALAAAGIVQGTAPGVFSAYEPVSRAQAVTMLVRAVQKLRPGVFLPAQPMFGSPGGDFDPTHAPNMALAAGNGPFGGHGGLREPVGRVGAHEPGAGGRDALEPVGA